MAENKKSVLLYCDLIHTVEGLEDDEAGRLFKHYLRYINDLKPEAPDKITKLVFEPIKQNLKRDLAKWEEKIDKRSDAGKKSAAKKQFNKWLLEHPEVYRLSKDDHLFEKGRCEKYQRESFEGEYTVEWFYYGYCIEFHEQTATKSTSVESVEQKETNSTVKDTVTVTDKVIVKDIIKKEKAFNFRKSLVDYGFEENLVIDWLKVRKTKKASNTQTAFNGFIKQVEISKIEINIVLTECINRSWAGFKSEWLSNTKNSQAKTEKKDAALILQERYGIQ